MANNDLAPKNEHIFDPAVVQDFYQRINDRLPLANQLPYEPYDEDEVIGLVTLYAFVGGNRRDCIARADPLSSLLQGKSTEKTISEAGSNNHPIGYRATRRLLTTGARGIAMCIASDSYVYGRNLKLTKSD